MGEPTGTGPESSELGRVIYIGIDPGLDGAVAIVSGRSIAVHDTPAVKAARGRDFLAAGMALLLRDYGTRRHEVVAALERGGAMPKQGLSSTFKTGRGIGLWEGILAALDVPYELVTPQRWKRDLGIPAGSGKDASRLHAQRLYPELCEQLARVKDHGRADALLLAEWRRRQG